MDKQQFYDYQIKPVLKAMSFHGNYNSLSARRILLVTAEVESRCGHHIKQVGGPAESAFQIEPPTLACVLFEWDAYLKNKELSDLVHSFAGKFNGVSDLLAYPLYATAIARGWYAMDSQPLPAYNDRKGVWEYYKRVWNTEGGATDEEEFNTAWQATARVVI